MLFKNLTSFLLQRRNPILIPSLEKGVMEKFSVHFPLLAPLNLGFLAIHNLFSIVSLIKIQAKLGLLTLDLLGVSFLDYLFPNSLLLYFQFSFFFLDVPKDLFIPFLEAIFRVFQYFLELIHLHSIGISTLISGVKARMFRI
jgi:hypothetical protein